MNPIHVPADATELPTPIGIGKHDLILEFPAGHYEWVKVNVEELKIPSRYGCAFRSAPCCLNGPSLEDRNDQLNHIARLAFGDGMWLRNGNARRLEPVGDGTSCSDIETRAPVAFENEMLYEVSQQLNSIFRTQSDERPDEPKNKKRKQPDELSLAREVSGKVQKLDVHSDDAKVRWKALLAEARTTKSIAFLVSKCNSGIEGLQVHHTRDNHNSECRPFAAMIQYRQTRGDDSGERLNRLFDEQAQQIDENMAQAGRSAKGDKWTSTFLGECTQRLRRHIQQKRGSSETLPESSSENTSKSQARQERRKEKRSYGLCKIVSNMSIHRGGDSWGLYPALEESEAFLSDIHLMAEDQMDNYAKSAARHVLQRCKIEDIPDSTLIIHPAAVLSWLSGEPYDWVCEALGLDEFADEDPGIAAELDTIARKYRLQTEEKSIWDRADAEARSAMKIPLDRLREVHKNAVRPNCRCSFHATEVATTTSQRQVVDEPSTASEHSSPTQASPQNSSHISVGRGPQSNGETTLSNSPQSSDYDSQRDMHTDDAFTGEQNSQPPTQQSQDYGVQLNEEGLGGSQSAAQGNADPSCMDPTSVGDASPHLPPVQFDVEMRGPGPHDQILSPNGQQDGRLNAAECTTGSSISFPARHQLPPIAGHMSPHHADVSFQQIDPATHTLPQPRDPGPPVRDVLLSDGRDNGASTHGQLCTAPTPHMQRRDTQPSPGTKLPSIRSLLPPQFDNHTVLGGQVDPQGLHAYASPIAAGAVDSAEFLSQELADWHNGGPISNAQDLTELAYDQTTETHGYIVSGALGSFGDDWGSLLHFDYGNGMSLDIPPGECQADNVADSLGNFHYDWSFLDNFTLDSDGILVAKPTESQ